MNYYNENNPKAAAWLRELILAGQIPDGYVDERSIIDVNPNDLHQYNQCHFFAGVAGWSYALRLAGWPESKPVFTGSCPCQPFSQAGRGMAEADERHLWPYFRNLIGHSLPTVVYGEQVASPLGRKWLSGVRADMEAAGYAFGAANLCAAGVSAPHKRQRLYWMAAVADTLSGRRGTRIAANIPQEATALTSDTGERIGIGMVQPNGAGWIKGWPTSKAAGFRSAAESTGSPESVAVSTSEQAQPTSKGRLHTESSQCSNAVVSSSQSEGQPRQDGGGLGKADEPGSPARSSSAWSDYDIVHMRDGKSRRIESGTQPLVAGLPKGMVHSRDTSLPLNPQATSEARVMRLHGYGNSIVPQKAAEFILASQEALELNLTTCATK